MEEEGQGREEKKRGGQGRKRRERSGRADRKSLGQGNP